MVQWTFPEGDRDYLRLIQRLPPDGGSVPHRQHVVSRAILKGFAAPGTSGHGWSLTPFNVARNEVQRDRGLTGCAYVRDFIMYAAQSAELAWKAVEDRLPPAITAARNGVLHASPSSDLRDTITDAIALHFVRNPRLLREESRLVAQATSDVRTRTLLEREAMVRDEFVRRYNLLPAGPQALEAVVDDAMIPWREYIKSGALTRVTLESLFERIRVGLRGMPIEVWHVPRDTELLISDNAAFTFAYSDSNSKINWNMAFGDSHGAALPIARDCLIAIGAAARDDVLPADKVDLFNELQVRNADAYVYFRPGSGLETFVRRIASIISPP
jgi:Protein of unknown function (DUF4238)